MSFRYRTTSAWTGDQARILPWLGDLPTSKLLLLPLLLLLPFFSWRVAVSMPWRACAMCEIGSQGSRGATHSGSWRRVHPAAVGTSAH
jgi:hypothetical protein